jgi:hypothetical protein
MNLSLKSNMKVLKIKMKEYCVNTKKKEEKKERERTE